MSSLTAAIPIIVQVLVIAASVTVSILTRPKPPSVEGQRLEDRAVSTSTYGNPIPRIDGGVRVGSNMIWSTDIREVRTTRKSGGGKGGKSATNTEYLYFGDFAMAFCEGDGEGAISQIFADRKLIYDATADATTFFKYKGAAIRIHMGAETEEPDPIIEADKGAGNVPAFRGLVYVVFEDMPLIDFGNRIPQIEAVVNTNSGVLAAIQEDTTDSASGGSTGSWFLPTHIVDHCVYYTQDTHQLYGVTVESFPWNSVFRVDMEGNDAGVALDADNPLFPFPPIPPYNDGLYSSVATGGVFYPIVQDYAGMNVGGVFPYIDGKVFVSGIINRVPVSGDATTWAILRVNPTTLRGIKTCGTYSGQATSGFHKPRADVSFTRQHPSGISNYTMFAHIASSSPALPAELFFFDRDQEYLMNSVTIGGDNEIEWHAACADRDGIVWVLGSDNLDSDPGPSNENAFLYRIEVNRVVSPATFLTIPAGENVDLDIVVGRIDLRTIRDDGGGIRDPQCMAYDIGSHSLIITGSPGITGASPDNLVPWIRFDLATQTIVVQRLFDWTTTLGKQHRLAPQNQFNWSQNGTINGALYATMLGTPEQTDPPEVVWRIRAVDLQETSVTVPDHLGNNTFSSLVTMTDVSTNSVFFLPSDDVEAGVFQRLQYDRVVPAPVTLTSVLERIFLDTGKLTLGDVDLTDADLVGLTVRGYYRGARSSARAALEPLTLPYQFEVIESADDSDAKLKVVVRGKSSMRAISGDDLAATASALQASGDQLAIDRSQENEIPVEVDLTYVDIDRDYQEGSQSARRIQTPTATNTSARQFSISATIVFNATEARRAVEAALYSAWVSRTSYGLKLGPKHMDLDPTDVVTVTREGTAYLMRLAKVEVGEGFSSLMGAESDDPESYISLAEGDSGDVTPQTLAAPGPTELFVLDIPLLRDVDDANQAGGGAYVAFGANTDHWFAAIAERSFDATEWERWSLSRNAAPWGYLNAAIAALPNDPDPEATASGTAARWVNKINTIDRTTSITIDMVQGTADLETITEDELFGVIGNGNVLIVDNGESAEVIKFATVVDNGDGTVTLSTLLRGRRGTEEAAVAGHATGTRVVFVDEFVLNRAGVDLTRITLTDLYRAISIGEIVETAHIQSLTWASNDNRPYPVSKPDTNSPRDGAARGTVTVTWTKRARLGGNRDLGDGVGADNPPLVEQEEAYEVDLIDSGAETVTLATKTVSGDDSDATGVQFTAGDRATGGYADADAFRIKIYQMSTIVGRGLPRDVTI